MPIALRTWLLIALICWIVTIPTSFPMVHNTVSYVVRYQQLNRVSEQFEGVAEWLPTPLADPFKTYWR